MPQHPYFKDNLEKSKDAVWFIARWMSEMGYSVRLNPTVCAESYKDWKKFADQGDIIIDCPVEVKASSYEFTCAEDYPFKNFMICASHSFDMKKIKPYAYVIVNKNRSYVAIVRLDTAPFWFTEVKHDPTKGIEQSFYFCSKSYVNFCKIDEPKEGSNGNSR